MPILKPLLYDQWRQELRQSFSLIDEVEVGVGYRSNWFFFR